MSVYNSLEWAGFVAEMRANPDEQTTPLVAADWLDDHGKGDHGAFIRGFSELSGVSFETREESIRGCRGLFRPGFWQNC